VSDRFGRPQPAAGRAAVAGRSGRGSPRRARRRLELARFWLARADLDEASRHGYRALRLIQEAASEPVDPAVEIRLTLARIERDRDDGEAARGHLEQAIHAIEAASADPDRDRLLARALLGLGDCHRRAARYSLAADVLDRSRRLAQTGDPVDASLLSEVFTALGITAKELGEFDRAERWYTLVGRIHDGAGATLAEAAALRHNLAGLDHARRRYPHAEAHARTAVALRRQDPGSTGVDIAAELAVLAAAIAGQHRYDEARDLFEQALDICRNARPARRYEVAVHLHNLAAIEQARGRPDEAERLYRQALALKEQLLGADHPEVGVVANNLGTLLCEQHRDAEAAAHFRRALAIVDRSYPPQHPTTAEIRRNLGRLAR